MTDITSDINQVLKDRHASTTIPKGEPRPPSTATADEFLKEAYRIVSMPPALNVTTDTNTQ